MLESTSSTLYASLQTSMDLMGMQPKVINQDQLDLFFRPEAETQRKSFFDDLTTKQYTSDQVAYIQRTYPLMLTHELTGQRRKIDGTPYIDHPRAMAFEAARMRLDPTLIIASMLHDVPEDVKIGALNNSEDWLKMIGETCADYEDKDRLMRILRAEQKTESLDKLEDKEEVIKYFADSPLGKRALSYLDTMRSGGAQIEEVDKKEVATVLYDLNRLMSDSYVPNADGSKSFDPYLLTVKILDTWQNLQTPGFWGKQLDNVKKDAGTVTKLIRARILTNVAEMFGMREVASSMTKNLHTLMNLNDIGDPQLKKTPLAELTESDKKFGEAIKGKVSNSTYTRKPISKVYQVPWAENTDFIGTRLLETYMVPTGELSASVKSGDIEHYGKTFTVGPPLMIGDGAIRATFQTTIGRSTVDHAISEYKSDNWEQIAKIRCERALPRFISTLKSTAHGRANQTDVPERNLFHPDICKYAIDRSSPEKKPGSLKNIDTSLIDLLEFLHSPREYASDTTGTIDTPYVLIINRKVFLATNKTEVKTLYQIAQNEGVANPTVRALGTDLSTAQRVTEGDANILNRLTKANALAQGLHMVVVVEEGY